MMSRTRVVVSRVVVLVVVSWVGVVVFGSFERVASVASVASVGLDRPDPSDRLGKASLRTSSSLRRSSLRESSSGESTR
jgi:hypothetical protein